MRLATARRRKIAHSAASCEKEKLPAILYFSRKDEQQDGTSCEQDHPEETHK